MLDYLNKRRFKGPYRQQNYFDKDELRPLVYLDIWSNDFANIGISGSGKAFVVATEKGEQRC